MPERPGDVPIDEIVNAGESELSDFYPTQRAETSMDTAMRQSAMRRSIYFGEKMRPDHASTRRDTHYALAVPLPDYVISEAIEIEGYRWQYSTPDDTPECRRRVFIERNQLIELDVDTSLVWLSAALGSQRNEETKRQLEQEAVMDNVNNQVILQLMYGRVENGEPLLPRSSKTLMPGSERG